MRIAAAGLLCLAFEASAADVVTFRQDWCPTSGERARLSAQWSLTMSGCCVFKAQRLGDPESAAAALAPFERFRSEEQDISQCTGDNAEVRAEAKKQAAAEAEEAEKAEREELAALPARASGWTREELCFAYGEALREAGATRSPRAALLASEVRRRRLTVAVEQVRQSRVVPGMSYCHMVAAWGYLTGQTSLLTQQDAWVMYHYGDARVHTRNGIVSSILR